MLFYLYLYLTELVSIRHMDEPLNENPVILEKWQLPQRENAQTTDSEFLHLSEFSLSSDKPASVYENEKLYEPVDNQEIFDMISPVYDPEHPLTLGQLAVVGLDRITVKDSDKDQELAELHVEITPTITHCSLATLIGLGLKVRLDRSLPPKFRILITVTPGSHQSEDQVNRQLNDKERVAAACENDQLLKVVEGMLAQC